MITFLEVSPFDQTVPEGTVSDQNGDGIIHGPVVWNGHYHVFHGIDRSGEASAHIEAEDSFASVCATTGELEANNAVSEQTERTRSDTSCY